MTRQVRAQRRALAKRLAGYSLAVGAAMVGAKGAEGAFVSSGPLSQNFGFDHGAYALTMEGATPEVQFNGHWYSDVSSTSRYAGRSFVASAVGNAFKVFAGGSAYPLAPGDKVGPEGYLPNANFGGFYARWGYSTWVGETWVPSNQSTVGYWTQDGDRHFIGFSFELESDGTTVYGWAEIERIDASNGRLLGWEYDDSGAPITVPEPAGLALLALGAAGVSALRKKRLKA